MKNFSFDNEILKVVTDFISALFETDGEVENIEFIVHIFSNVFIAVCFLFLCFAIFRGLLILKKQKIKFKHHLLTLELLDKINSFDENFLIEEKEVSLTKDEFKYLLLKCEELGYIIDSHTNRKRNSEFVSRIIYGISEKLNLSPENCFINYCASFVYDAGFLDVDEEYFSSELLNKDERNFLRTHTVRGINRLKFISENLREYFLNSCAFHHENFDGSGYPENLCGADIPSIAMMIHIAETYVSLTSTRSYHKSMSKNEALKVIEKSASQFDPKYVSILREVI